MRTGKAILLSLLALATVAGLTAAIAAAEKEKSGKDHSKELEFTTIQPNKVEVEVDEGKKRFNRNRMVVIKYKPGPGAPQQKLGSDKTNRKGIAQLKGSFFVGHYKAVLKPAKKAGRIVRAREEDAVVEEEVDEDEDPDANAAGNGTRTFTTTTE